MANTSDGRSHNQPSHEASVKGGEHSHSGKQSQQEQSSDSTKGQQGAGQQGGKSEDGRSHNQPSHEAQVKGGQHSHDNR